MRNKKVWKSVCAFTLALGLISGSMSGLSAVCFAEDAAAETEAITETAAETKAAVEVTAADESASAETAPAETVTAEVSSAAEDIIESGKCGDNATYTLDKYGVLRISGTGAVYKNAFSASGSNYEYRNTIKMAVVGEGITELGNGAFYRCYALEQIFLPSTLTRIEKEALYNMNYIRDLFILADPDQLSWEDPIYATVSCCHVPTELVERYRAVIGEERLKIVGETAKGSCGDNANYCLDTDGNLFIFGTGAVSGDSLRADVFPYASEVKSVHISEGIMELEADALSGYSQLNAVSLPHSMTAIGDRAFQGWEALTELHIYENVHSIGEDAFKGCTSLEHFHLDADPEQLTWNASAGSDFMPEKKTVCCVSNAYAEKYQTGFSNVNVSFMAIRDMGSCGENASYTLDNDGTLTITGTGTIAEYAFAEDYYPYQASIRKVVISEGITEIGKSAFENCDDLREVTIPSTVTTIGDNVFQFANRLDVIYLHADPDALTWENSGFYRFGGYYETICCVAPEHLERYQQKFADQTAPIVTVIDSGECGEGTVYILDSEHRLNIYTINGGIIKDNAFNGYAHASEIEALSIRRDITQIGDYAFNDFTAVKKITEFPNAVERIGEGAFCNCSALTFMDCYAGATEIGKAAFQNCSSLETVYLYEEVTNIGEDAFSGCTSLKDLILFADPDALTWTDANGDDFAPGKETICHVSGDYIDTYRAKFGDRNVTYADYIEKGSCGENATFVLDFDGNLTVSGTGAIRAHAFDSDEFYNCFLIYNAITIEEGITEIGEEAFDFEFEESLTLPSTLTTVEKGAFDLNMSTANVYLYPDPEKLKWNNETKSNFSSRYDTLLHVYPSYLEKYQELFGDVLHGQFVGDLEEPQNIASDETLVQWALVDYEKKTGVAVKPEITSAAFGQYEITIKDAEGNVLDVYTIDPHTGIGTNNSGAEVNLPQTGVTSASAAAAVGGAVVLTAAGFWMVRRASRRRNEEEA